MIPNSKYIYEEFSIENLCMANHVLFYTIDKFKEFFLGLSVVTGVLRNILPNIYIPVLVSTRFSEPFS
jgi:hypothetical protein